MSEIIGEGEVRRFFKEASAIRHEPADAGWCIELDGRIVKTPMGKTFLVPSAALAEAVAEEWNAQGDKIIPDTMPLAALANAATDRIAAAPPFFIDQLLGYARSDLLCYWSEGPPDLVERQHDAWQPILDWVEEAFGARFITTVGVVPIDQPEDALNAFSGVIKDVSAFHLAGLIDMAGMMSSVLLALAVWKERISAEEAFQRAFLDEVFQEELWGEDYDAVQRRAVIKTDLMATTKFLQLLDVA